MAREKKPVHKVVMTEGKRSIIQQLLQEYAEIFRQRTYHCVECGAAFVPNSNRQKYCPACSKRVHRRQKNESERKRRADS